MTRELHRKSKGFSPPSPWIISRDRRSGFLSFVTMTRRHWDHRGKDGRRKTLDAIWDTLVRNCQKVVIIYRAAEKGTAAATSGSQMREGT